jgi:hypothetical protein
MQALPAINTPTLQKANVPECKEIFENFQENFPGIRCFQCRKIYLLTYTQKIEILAPCFTKYFQIKILQIKKRHSAHEKSDCSIPKELSNRFLDR